MKEININQDGLVVKEGEDTLILTNKVSVLFSKKKIEVCLNKEEKSDEVIMSSIIDEQSTLRDIMDYIVLEDARKRADEILKDEVEQSNSIHDSIQKMIDNSLDSFSKKLKDSIEYCNSTTGNEKIERINKQKPTIEIIKDVISLLEQFKNEVYNKDNILCYDVFWHKTLKESIDKLNNIINNYK